MSPLRKAFPGYEEISSVAPPPYPGSSRRQILPWEQFLGQDIYLSQTLCPFCLIQTEPRTLNSEVSRKPSRGRNLPPSHSLLTCGTKCPRHLADIIHSFLPRAWPTILAGKFNITIHRWTPCHLEWLNLTGSLDITTHSPKSTE